ncbi:hypothetical protein [Streptomyces sp. NPDC058861]|uniref:hypothetical protein n=1 Tax=Streptomyces sp. NPDC058861 TaxID=3346653 RepID=UPI0036C86C4E
MAENEVPGPGASPDELERAVASLRRAARADPARCLPRLGHGLLRLGSLIGTEPGRLEEAGDVLEEAAGVYRRLPEEYLPGLGIALRRKALALRRARLDRHDEVAAPTAEAVRHLRDLDRIHPNNDVAALAGSLARLGPYPRRLGHRAAARDAERAAGELRRRAPEPGR